MIVVVEKEVTDVEINTVWIIILNDGVEDILWVIGCLVSDSSPGIIQLNSRAKIFIFEISEVPPNPSSKIKTSDTFPSDVNMGRIIKVGDRY